MLKLDYGQNSAALARFFAIEPLAGETLAVHDKVLRGSYQLKKDNPTLPRIQRYPSAVGQIVDIGAKMLVDSV